MKKKEEPKKVIREVWKENFDEELKETMKALRKAKYIGMDTEFPGIVNKLNQQNNDINSYSLVRENCNVLKVIQIGFTLADEKGELVSEDSIWQFNFHFDLEKEKKNDAAIKFLTNSGIDFDKLKARCAPRPLPSSLLCFGTVPYAFDFCSRPAPSCTIP